MTLEIVNLRVKISNDITIVIDWKCKKNYTINVYDQTFLIYK